MYELPTLQMARYSLPSHTRTHTHTHTHTHTGVDADYIAIASPSSILTFPAGSSVTNNPFTTSSQCFTVSIVNDNLLDPNENFFLSIVGTTGLAVIDSNRNQATVNIIDNDIGLPYCIKYTIMSIRKKKIHLAYFFSTNSVQ